MPIPLPYTFATLDTSELENALDSRGDILGKAVPASYLDQNFERLANAINVSSSAPSNPFVGMFWLDTSVNPPILKQYDGSTWINSFAPSGSDGQVQFNDNGSFGGDTSFVWNKTSNILSLQDSRISLTYTSNNNFILDASPWWGAWSGWGYKGGNLIKIKQNENLGTSTHYFVCGLALQMQDNDNTNYYASNWQHQTEALRVEIVGSQNVQYKDLVGLSVYTKGNIGWPNRGVSGILAEVRQYGSGICDNELWVINPSDATSASTSMAALQLIIQANKQGWDASHNYRGLEIVNSGYYAITHGINLIGSAHYHIGINLADALIDDWAIMLARDHKISWYYPDSTTYLYRSGNDLYYFDGSANYKLNISLSGSTSNGQVLFNDNGSFGGDPTFIFDKTAKCLKLLGTSSSYANLEIDKTFSSTGDRQGAIHSVVTRSGGSPMSSVWFQHTCNAALTSGFEVGVTSLIKGSNMGGGSLFSEWLVAASPRTSWTGWVVGMEINPCERYADAGKVYNWRTNPHGTVGIIICPENNLNLGDGSPVGYNISYGLVFSYGGTYPYVRMHIPLYFDQTSIAPGGTGICMYGGTSATDDPDWAIEFRGHFDKGIDFSNAVLHSTSQVAIQLVNAQSIAFNQAAIYSDYSNNLTFYDPNVGTTRTLSQFVITNSTPTFAGLNSTGDIILDNAIRLKGKDASGTPQTLIYLDVNGNVVIGSGGPTINIGYNSTQDNPIAIRVGGVNSKVIEVGPPDSGGTGYRVLRVAN